MYYFTLPKTYNAKALGQMSVEGAQTLDQNTRQKHKGWLPVVSRMSGPPRQHRTEYKGHTLSPRIEIKIPSPAEDRTRDIRLKSRDVFAPTSHKLKQKKFNLNHYFVII